MTYPTAEALAREIGIDVVPEAWANNWQAFQQWKSFGGCGAVLGDIPSNAVEVFDIPSECLPDLRAVGAEIRSNPTLAELAGLWHFLLFHQPGTRALAEDVMPAPTAVLCEQAPVFHIAVLVSGTNDILDAYRKIGVPDRVVMDSLAQCGGQIRDHFDKHGVYGMRYLGWMRNYFNAVMFRLGRLVFNPNTYTWAFRVYHHKTTVALQTLCTAGQQYRADGMANGCNGVNDPNAWTSELDILAGFVRGNPVSPTGEAIREQITLSTDEWEPLLSSGDHMIEIHIPPASSGGRMAWEECAASYAQALEFFPRFYPEMDFKVFTCWSWLLDPSLSKILPPESNIVKFQSPFHLFPVCSNEKQCYDLAFGDPNLDMEAFVPKTSLQRAIQAYVLAGHCMRGAAGFITMDEMSTLVV